MPVSAYAVTSAQRYGQRLIGFVFVRAPRRDDDPEIEVDDPL